MRQTNIVILGSTGSIGINTLKVVARFPRQFRIVGLSAYNNLKLIENQVKQFNPDYVAVKADDISYLKKRVPPRVKVLDVHQDLNALVSHPQTDRVVIAMRGAAALMPFLSALKAGKIVCPANKEAIVIAGDILMNAARKYRATIIPIDSEQSAIFQCLNGQKKNELKRIHLTASGGPLLNMPRHKFGDITVEKILKHPRWKMGHKITVDSATLMNKGFEVIEAKHLFGVDVSDINVVIHPQAIIHSMVEFVDGSILAQLAVTDMRLPIQFALTYPHRMATGLKPLSFWEWNRFDFQKPDFKRFPALSLAIYAGKKEGTLPSVLNAADEEAVDAFLRKEIRFTDIYAVVEKAVLKHRNILRPNLTQILDADLWARQETRQLMERIK